jgi:single-strand DNA-binding protein
MSNETVARYKNEVHLAGTLAKDPVIRYTTSGKAVSNLTVATQYKEATEYHAVTCWEGLAEKVAPLIKGEFVKVVGRLATRSWDDKQTGQKKYRTEIVAFQISIPDEEPAPLTPDAIKSGTDIARAILRPAKEASDGDPAF